MAVFHHQIEEAEQRVQDLQSHYLRRFGWEHTSMTPGSYWLWRRDFAKEDTERLAWWKEAHGPLGKPSMPVPYGVITAPTDLAVSITVRALDKQLELAPDIITVEILPIGTAAHQVRDGIKHTYALRENGDGWVYRSRTSPKALWCPIENAADVPQEFKDAIAEFMAEHPASEPAGQ